MVDYLPLSCLVHNVKTSWSRASEFVDPVFFYFQSLRTLLLWGESLMNSSTLILTSLVLLWSSLENCRPTVSVCLWCLILKKCAWNLCLMVYFDCLTYSLWHVSQVIKLMRFELLQFILSLYCRDWPMVVLVNSSLVLRIVQIGTWSWWISCELLWKNLWKKWIFCVCVSLLHSGRSVSEVKEHLVCWIWGNPKWRFVLVWGWVLYV